MSANNVQTLFKMYARLVHIFMLFCFCLRF